MVITGIVYIFVFCFIRAVLHVFEMFFSWFVANMLKKLLNSYCWSFLLTISHTTENQIYQVNSTEVWSQVTQRAPQHSHRPFSRLQSCFIIRVSWVNFPKKQGSNFENLKRGGGVTNIGFPNIEDANLCQLWFFNLRRIKAQFFNSLHAIMLSKFY